MQNLKRDLSIVGGAVLIATHLATSTQAGIAEVVCDDRDRMKTRLEQTYGAQLQGTGLRGPETVMQIWIVPRTGEWTMVQSYTNGKSCIVAMGEMWEMISPTLDPV